MEAVGILLLHLRELEVVGGDDAGDGERGDGLEEEARAIELVERVGALQYFVEDDEGVARNQNATYLLKNILKTALR